VGNEGKVMKEDAAKLVSILKSRYNENMAIHFEYFTNENHASILHNAVYKAFEIMNKTTKK
jgi:predicted alpha/beta superfamily hydrolase